MRSGNFFQSIALIETEIDKNMNKPFLILMCGTSGSGKTTIGTGLEKYLKEKYDLKVQLLDGDDYRSRCSGAFGYTEDERIKLDYAFNTTISYLFENGISVIESAVNGNRDRRKRKREKFGEQYIQCYVKCSFEECLRRDPKGYYKKYVNGEMENFNVVGKGFDVPEDSEIVVDTEKMSPDEAVKTIGDFIENWLKK